MKVLNCSHFIVNVWTVLFSTEHWLSQKIESDISFTVLSAIKHNPKFTRWTCPSEWAGRQVKGNLHTFVEQLRWSEPVDSRANSTNYDLRIFRRFHFVLMFLLISSIFTDAVTFFENYLCDFACVNKLKKDFAVVLRSLIALTWKMTTIWGGGDFRQTTSKQQFWIVPILLLGVHNSYVVRTLEL